MLHRKKLSLLSLLLVFVFALSCFTIYPAGNLAASESATITVVSPGTGDTWAGGSQQTISWNYTGNPGSQVTITLFKGGHSVMHIASKTATGSNGSGSYTWGIPYTMAEGSDYQIKVLSPTCPDGDYSVYFSIGAGATSTSYPSQSATITVVSPGTGDTWAGGSQQTISWNYAGDAGSEVTITLFKGGNSVTHIASKTAAGSNGSGSYTWTIPATLAEGSDYQIKIITPEFSNAACSGYFTIGSGGSTETGNSISITSPARGEVFAQGSANIISWSYTGADLGPTVDISLFRVSSQGISRYNIKSGAAIGSGGNGTYAWNIPAEIPAGQGYKIMVWSVSQRRTYAISNAFTIGTGGSTQQTTQTETILINDPAFVTLTALENGDQGYDLQVKANNASTPVEVSYLVLNPSATPTNPSQGIQVAELTESESSWGGSKQYYGHTEVGGWALSQYKQNPKVFALPHYRTCVMMLARYEKIYVVFLRENDGILTYEVFQGGAFNGLNVPGLGNVTRSGNQFKIHSEGGAVEVGIWDKGTYKHDEVTGWAQQSYAANDKMYDIPNYGMFMMTIGRYGKLGLIIGNYNDGQLGTVCFTGSKLLGTDDVSGLCEITSAGSPHIRVRATGNDPVEFSQFAFDNTCWQWEVNGWGQAAFQQNPQVLPLKHYTPGFFTCSRYDKAGIFFYNENDGQMGVLPLNSSTQVAAASAAATQTQASSAGVIKVYLNGQLLSFDQPPVIVGGRTMVPMRAIFEALGAEVSWDGAARMVTARLGDTTIKLIIGMQSAQVNGHETALDQPAQIMGGRTMVPLRFVAEALDCQVIWNGDTRTIYITQNTAADSGTEQLTGEQVIERFFSLVDSGEVNSALTLLDTEALGDSSSQAMWQSSLGSIDAAAVISIQASNQAEWTNDYEQYMVSISLQLTAGSQTLWSEGQDTRWISLMKESGQWKIHQIATGP